MTSKCSKLKWNHEPQAISCEVSQVEKNKLRHLSFLTNYDFILFYSTRAVIGQFCRPYFLVGPAKFQTFFCGQNVFERFFRNLHKALQAERDKRRENLQDEENQPKICQANKIPLFCFCVIDMCQLFEAVPLDCSDTKQSLQRLDGSINEKCCSVNGGRAFALFFFVPTLGWQAGRN